MPTMEQIADKLTVLYLKILPEQKNDYEIIKYGNENIISKEIHVFPHLLQHY